MLKKCRLSWGYHCFKEVENDVIWLVAVIDCYSTNSTLFLRSGIKETDPKINGRIWPFTRRAGLIRAICDRLQFLLFHGHTKKKIQSHSIKFYVTFSRGYTVSLAMRAFSCFSSYTQKSLKIVTIYSGYLMNAQTNSEFTGARPIGVCFQ